MAISLDITCLLKASLLPSKMLILLAGACLAWVGLLSVAFLAFTGLGLGAAWVFAGALMFALVVWALVMGGEFRNAAMTRASAFSDDDDVVTGPLPRRSRKFTYRLRYIRPTASRLPGFARTRATFELKTGDSGVKR